MIKGFVKASDGITVNGIAKLEHSRLHYLIIKKAGNASKCENKECRHKNPKRFEWALKKGRHYSDNPDDYIQLCVSCHRKYDFTEEIRTKLKAAKVGEKHNKAKLKEKDVIQIYSMLSHGFQNKDIATKFNVDNSTISDIKRGKRWTHIYHLYKQAV